MALRYPIDPRKHNRAAVRPVVRSYPSPADRSSRAFIRPVVVVFWYWAAITIPAWFGFLSTTTAGMIALVSGLGFLIATLVTSEG